MPYTKNVYFSGQGKVFVGLRNSDGTRGVPLLVGNAPEFSVSFETEKDEVLDAMGGQRLIDNVLVTAKKASFKLTLYSMHTENVELMVNGTKRTLTGTTVTNELFGSPMVINDYYKTKQENISAITVKDSAGTPATLVLNTDYKVDDAGFGRIQILNLGAYVQPFKIDYTYATRTQVSMFDTALTERFVEFHALNTANANKKMYALLYRTLPEPVKDMSLLNTEHAKFELEGTALWDSVAALDSNLGPFGRISYVDTP